MNVRFNFLPCPHTGKAKAAAAAELVAVRIGGLNEGTTSKQVFAMFKPGWGAITRIRTSQPKGADKILAYVYFNSSREARKARKEFIEANPDLPAKLVAN